MTTALLILHGLAAVALLGAITHQTLAAWAPSGARRATFLRRFRGVQGAAFANAIVALYAAVALLGGVVYLYFAADISPVLTRNGHWRALGFFELKEDFTAIGLGLLPAYWICWRRAGAELGQKRAILTAILAFIVWWDFLVGHVLNDMMGFGS